MKYLSSLIKFESNLAFLQVSFLLMIVMHSSANSRNIGSDMASFIALNGLDAESTSNRKFRR